MINKKSYIKQTILVIMIIVLFCNFNIISYAEAISNNIDMVQAKNNNLEINVEYKYNAQNNTVTVNMHSNNELKYTKPSWTLSQDKLTYTKTFGANDIYETPVEDIYGNITTVKLEITQIKPIITVEYIKNSNNTVTAIMHSTEELKDTKPSWTLSQDRLSYTKTFGANEDYTTDVEDIYGNVVTVRIIITQIVTQEPFNINVEYKKNANNTVTAIMHSNRELKHTKPSWTLSEDKLSYTKTFGANEDYTTDVEDIYGNIVTVRIIITQIDTENPFTVTVEYKKNANNTVTAIMHSNRELKHTKPSWTLSEDKLSYTKTFGANEDYTTDVEDIYGNIVTVRIIITQIDTENPFTVTVEYKKNANNTVTAIMHSNRELKHTKPTWTLSEDKLSYTKTFGANDIYETQVEDIEGNVTTVTIKITEIMLNITVEYIKNANNTVTAIMHSNSQLKDTKPSWTLSTDRLSYTKTFGVNDVYETNVEDIYGHSITVKIEVTTIAPTITVEYIRNNNNTVTVIMHSNEPLKDTKPSWTLSEDKLSYTKTFGASEDYTTDVEDIYGNVTTVRITISLTNNSNFSNLDESKYPGYKTLLQQLQNQHPNWTIKLVYTGLDWNNALDIESGYAGNEENKEPYSLTQATGAWRDSSDQNTYQGGWYKASREAIAYMMDPRNSLDQYYVFQFQNMARSSIDTVGNVSTMTNGTFLQNYVNDIVNASMDHNVSAFHLASRMLLEQGTSGWSINGYQYNGRTVYNYANIGATGGSAEEIIQNGAAYAYNHHWFTPQFCIDGTAEWIYNNYLNKGQNTKYFEKFNVIKQPFGSNQYMQNIRAANDEGYNTAKSLEKGGLLKYPYEFLIPVYENMPSTPCARPNT